MEINMQDSLDELLRGKIKENGMSMREFSRLVGIDPAIISKIMNGKRKANMQHLMAFSEYLNIPLATLLTVAGYEKQPIRKNNPLATIQSDVNHIQSLIDSFGIQNVQISLEKVEESIECIQKNLEKNDHAPKKIRDKFIKKYVQAGKFGDNFRQLHDFFDAFLNRKGSKKQLLLMGSALFYFITTVDIIPDYIFSLGYLDDVVIIKYINYMLTVNS